MSSLQRWSCWSSLCSAALCKRWRKQTVMAALRNTGRRLELWLFSQCAEAELWREMLRARSPAAAAFSQIFICKSWMWCVLCFLPQRTEEISALLSLRADGQCSPDVIHEHVTVAAGSGRWLRHWIQSDRWALDAAECEGPEKAGRLHSTFILLMKQQLVSMWRETIFL